jgi:hypothetical protein
MIRTRQQQLADAHEERTQPGYGAFLFSSLLLVYRLKELASAEANPLPLGESILTVPPPHKVDWLSGLMVPMGAGRSAPQKYIRE